MSESPPIKLKSLLIVVAGVVGKAPCKKDSSLKESFLPFFLIGLSESLSVAVRSINARLVLGGDKLGVRELHREGDW